MNARRAAMTLVELMVVAGLLIALFGLMAVGLRGDSADPRKSAREFASVMLAGQSRALGKPEGAAVIVAVAPTDDGRIGSIVHEARSQPLIIAGIQSGWMPPANPAVTTTTGTIQADVTGGYKVRFLASSGGGGGSASVSPWYLLQTDTASSAARVGFRTNSGQTGDNTVWPKNPPAPGALQAVVARWPMPGAAPIILPKQVAIDLRHSGVGDDPSALRGFGRLEGKGPIAIVYDEVGRVVDVMQRVGDRSVPPVDPLVPSQPVYLLFAFRDDIVAGRNTLANAKSTWVAIHPLTGRVTVAANVPQVAEDASALQAARANVRRGMIAK